MKLNPPVRITTVEMTKQGFMTRNQTVETDSALQRAIGKIENNPRVTFLEAKQGGVRLYGWGER
jgi:hypothetical protein